MIFQSFRRKVTFKAASSIKWSGYENRRGCVVRVLWTLLLLRRIFSRNRVNTHAKRRFPANCFVFLCFSYLSAFHRALSSRIGSVLLIVARFFDDFEMKTQRRASARTLFIVSRPWSETGGKLFSRGKKSDSSRNDSLECNKRLKAADEKLFASYENFLLAFFEGSFVASRLPLGLTPSINFLREESFVSNQSFRVPVHLPSFCLATRFNAIVENLKILGLNRCDRRPFSLLRVRCANEAKSMVTKENTYTYLLALNGKIKETQRFNPWETLNKRKKERKITKRST